MNNIDLELFKILDSEIDKTLKLGCKLISYSSDYYTFTRYDGDNYKCLENDILVLKPSFTKILGNYPKIIDVLRFINKNTYHIDDMNNCLGFGDFLRIKVKNEYQRKNDRPYTVFYLDITKEIEYYTNIQKQELINFLNKIYVI